MVGALPLEVFESLPSFIWGLSISPRERSDVNPLLCSFARWKVLTEEILGEIIPSSERVGLLILQPVTGLIPQ